VNVPEPRDRLQRRQDTLHRLTHDVDLWVATAAGDGVPYLVPLSFCWDGAALWLATPTASPTGRNLAASGRVKVALGTTRDVVLVEASAQLVGEPAVALLEAFAARTGFDPREDPAYGYFRLVPQRIQAWREENELAGRLLMRDGGWLS
jgi:general stress protein 26